MKELFRDVAGYEGLYEISSLGNVRSLNYNHTGQTRVLKLRKTKDGYLQISLNKNSNRNTYKVHRLVATAFIDNPDNLPEVNHKDENKENNRVENLEWCTHAYNNNYGTHQQRSAETRRGVERPYVAAVLINNPKRSKKLVQLTLDYVLVKEWASTMECGRNGFHSGHVSDCCNGKRKTHKGYRWMYAEDYYKMYAN